MNAIMIPLPPKTCEQIFSGKQTMVLMKKLPKLTPPYRVYVYCNKGKLLVKALQPATKKIAVLDRPMHHEKCIANVLNGKVIGSFVCNKTEEFVVGSLACDDIQMKTCKSYGEMIDYFYKGEIIDGKTMKTGIALHITEAQLFDEPKNLSAFENTCKEKVSCRACFYSHIAKTADGFEYKCDVDARLTRPPATFVYVEEV